MGEKMGVQHNEQMPQRGAVIDIKTKRGYDFWEDVILALIESAPVALLGLKDGRVFFANGHVERLTGWSTKELLGEKVEKLIPFSVPTSANQILHENITRKDGSSLECCFHVATYSRKGYVFTVIAIEEDASSAYRRRARELETHIEEKTSELKAAKEELERKVSDLRKGEREKQAIIDSVKDHVLLLDGDLHIQFANRAIKAYFHKSDEDLRGRKCFEVLYGRPQPCPHCPAKRSIAERIECMSDHTDSRGRTWLYRSYPVLDEAGKVIGAVETASDITYWKQYEETLRQSEERYRTIIENMDDGYFENDLRGNLTFVNESLCRILGRKREELIGLNFRAYTPENEAKRVREAYRELFRTKVPIKIFDHEITRPNGEIRYVDVSTSLITDRSGNPIGFRGTVKDVTERKKMEEETKKLNYQLYQSQKFKAIGTLAGGIAHDFNNLLMGIQGYTSLVLLDLDPSHPHYEKLKAIEAQVQSGADLTRQLLGFARGGKYEVKKTNLNELLKNTVRMFARTKKELVIHENYAPELWPVEVDRGQIEQVILNLLLNAWQAMPSGGSIYITTENCVLEETLIEYFNVPPGRYVKFSITDTGVGMDEKTLERIFEPFFTTKEMGRGTGLGLATAYGIIKGHGGVIKVYSEKGHGSTFNIYLPATTGEAPREEQGPRREISRGQGKILIVDDEQIIRDVSRALLEGLGYQVIVAKNGEEAVSIYKEKAGEIDLVILDMIMPGMGGSAVFELLKQINPEVKVILSSGYSLNGMAKDIMDQGAKGFLQKPFRLDDLSQKIKEVLHQN
ncbi:MAG: PAS domain S-box protein [Syntrophales bacterium]|nr:PAS domain S-box protein [Syntrophales bacterium]